MKDGNEAADIQSTDENPEINITGVDTEKGLALYYDEMDIYLQALRSYAANTPAVLDKIRNVSGETLQDYTINIHGIKGTSANIGAEEIKNNAALLESMSKSGDLDGVLAKNEAFIKEVESVVAGIKAWLEQYDVKI